MTPSNPTVTMTSEKALELTREAIMLILALHSAQEIKDQLVIDVLTDTLYVTEPQHILDPDAKQMADWLDEAADDIGNWGGYASEYFQNKHDLLVNIQDFRTRADNIRSILGNGVVT